MIVQTINDDYYFWNWLKQSDSYNNKFTLQGAKALQAYLDELSDEIGYDHETDLPTRYIEFDPIAWCVEYTEYKNIDELNEAYGSNYSLDMADDRPDLSDVTTVIEVEGDSFIVQDF